MSNQPSESLTLSILEGLTDPATGQSLLSVLSSYEWRDQTLVLELPYPADFVGGGLKGLIESQFLAEDVAISVDITWSVQDSGFDRPEPLQQVKHIIPVASGKGGVGKSTTSVSLALALAAEGAKVGLLDADIYGPSIGLMLGIADGARPEGTGNGLKPLIQHGLKVMSMAFLVTDQTPIVWRGPKASGALLQLLTQTQWGGLDYLVVDMPPGTGDIQLTLAQRVPVSGAVVVTTPQTVATLDANRGIEMFTKVGIPVLGVIENMSGFRCPSCDSFHPIFGEGGGAAVAEQYKVPLLAAIPLDGTIRAFGDKGSSPLLDDPNAPLSLVYREAARQVAGGVAMQQMTKAPEISIAKD